MRTHRLGPFKDIKIDEAVELDLPGALRWLASKVEPLCHGNVGIMELRELSRRDLQLLATSLELLGRFKADIEPDVERELQARGLMLVDMRGL